MMLYATELRESLFTSHKMFHTHLDRLIACCESMPEDNPYREELRKIHQSLSQVVADIKRDLTDD
jgi:ATP-dependent RNA circularization protein (DNA/RNA ligase family)